LSQQIISEKDLDKLKQSNLDRLQALATQGIALSVGDLAFVKMEALIEMLLTEDQKAVFEYKVELKKKEIIDQVMAEIRKAQLTQNTPAARTLLVPGR
jgi:Mg/Co/Ni transporter MgtE